MATSIWSAYAAIVTALSTGLNSLGNNNTALSAAIDNSAAKSFYMDIEVNLASVDLSAQVNPAIQIWLLSRTDGTNFEDGSAGTPGTVPARPPDKVIPLRVVNAAQRVFARGLLITPDQIKILVRNQAGAALAATLNTVKYYTYSEVTA
jgi:hypothetical protein